MSAFLLEFTPNDLKIIKQRYKNRIESMYAVEEAVDAIIKSLKEKELFDNTYIFFVSDNGFHLGEHRMLFGKSTTYESDIRVPFIVIGPDVVKGLERKNISGLIDLAPTWMDLAGLDPPVFVDGVSLVPLFRDGSPLPRKWRNTILLEHWGADSEDPEEAKRDKQKGAQPTVVGIRTNQGKYVQYQDDSGECYDEMLDPEELENQVSNPEYLTRVTFLKNRLSKLRSCAGKSCSTLLGPFKVEE